MSELADARVVEVAKFAWALLVLLCPPKSPPPELGVEEPPPNSFGVSLFPEAPAFPNMPPEAGAVLVVAVPPNMGAADVVAVLPPPKSPPLAGWLPLWPPKRPAPLAGLSPPPELWVAVPKENLGGSPAAPNRPPEAGAVDEVLPDDAPEEAGVPKLNAMAAILELPRYGCRWESVERPGRSQNGFGGWASQEVLKHAPCQPRQREEGNQAVFQFVKTKDSWKCVPCLG